MATFTIDTDNNIAAHAEAPAAGDHIETFSSEKQLAKLAAGWPAARLVEVWNSFAGIAPFDDLKPVKKFTNRKAAVARLWSAVQRLADESAPQSPTVAPEKAPAGKRAGQGKRRNTAQTGAKQAREGSKKGAVLDLLRRKEGATLGQITEITGWQAHTVRGFIAGTVTKKLGLTVESFRGEDKERTYRINS